MDHQGRLILDSLFPLLGQSNYWNLADRWLSDRDGLRNWVNDGGRCGE
jgi:hypothetical protein